MSDLARELQGLTRSFLQTHAPVRQQLDDDDGATWKRLSEELGLTSLATEAGLVEITTVLEETGRTLLRAPLLCTLVGAAALAACSPDDVPDAGVSIALALDPAAGLTAIPHAAQASLLLVADAEGLVLHDAFTATPCASLDGTRPVADVTLTGSGRRVGDTGAADRARDLLWTALAAECVGAGRRVLESTVEHLKDREQFGRPLGSFQALRHRVADLTVALEAATSSAWWAARCDDNERAVAAPLACATATDMLVELTGESIQLHGGIGFTWEHDAHLYFKRAWSTALVHDSRTLRRLAFDRSGV